MQHMMRRMGMQQQDVDASEVIIRTAEKDFLFANPQVTKVNVMGQETWQVVGQSREIVRETFSADDVKTVAEQASVSEEDARKALSGSKGDLAEAILKLKK